ncbi:15652_t:CDS:2 [Funneliformis mosseae]|uniref:15652_t:CDS:1 n=1 Tax=Funneliformis mosseae TaxID=27381 RepID=A0A9N9GHN0_FUNMO|nr:15652_t:CDS:2 [Funneliformis mosseae]
MIQGPTNKSLLQDTYRLAVTPQRRRFTTSPSPFRYVKVVHSQLDGGRQKMINVSIPQVTLKILSVLFEEQPDDELRSISGILQSLKKKGRIYTNDRNIIVTVFRRIFWNHPKNPPYYIDVLTASSLQHLIPGHAGQGSARSDFASIIINNNDLQFAFFIVEFEQAGFEIHKDEVVVVAELAYEFNRILSQMHYPTEMEVNETSLHFGLVNDMKVRLGRIQPIYNQEKLSLVYTYEDEIISFNFQENNVEAKWKMRPVQLNYNLKLALPELPKEAVQSRKFETKFTPVTMRRPSHKTIGSREERAQSDLGHEKHSISAIIKSRILFLVTQ